MAGKILDGTVLPTQPSIFQQYIQQKSTPATSGWVITSKDKLFILSNSSATGWRNLYRPSFNCGVNGDGTGGYREDSVTQPLVLQKLISDKPALMIVNYNSPDAMGHAANWAGYLAAIREVDRYVKQIWDTVQATPALKDSTVLFIVNDHGRHTTDYTSHGDACEGCCYLLCLAIGSNIRVGMTDTITREQRDYAPTIAKLLGFTMSTATGVVMTEILDTSVTTGISVKGVAAAPVFSADVKVADYDVSGRKISAANRNRGLVISTVVSNGVKPLKNKYRL